MDITDSALWDLFENQKLKALLGPMRSTLAKIKKSGHVDSRWFNTMGEMSVAEKNYSSAVSFFRKAIELDPKPDYELNLGNALFYLKDFHTAKTVLTAYSKRHPEDIHVLVNLANCHLQLADYPMVHQICSQGLEGKVAKAPLWNCLGQAEFLMKNYTKAWELFDNAYADSPEYIDALFNRANTAYHLGNNKAAIDDYALCLRKDENYLVALLNLVVLYLESGQWEKGKEVITRALKLDSECVEAYLLLGQLHLGSKDFRGAREAFQKGLKRDSNHISLLLALAKLHAQEAEKEEAALILKHVLCKKSIKLEERVNALTQMMEIELYQNCLQELNELNQFNLGSVLKKIQICCLWKTGKIKEAISFLDELLESEGESADILTLLGKMLTQSGAEVLAEARYRRALDLEPGTQGAGCELAKILLGRNETQKAIAILKEVYEKHPQDSDCLYNLSCCFAKIENLPDSLQYLKLAIESGFHDLDQIVADDDLKYIRQFDEYNQVVGLLA